ncbi:MAG: M28 family peptidase [Balneolaceae bacterium]|nr:M28 family peptidase [Balneolaceae bacterium]MBO6545898.1 M28 family peptidase [Balneolaceae bacterium]MBO6647294.1 M28 family peptidase [Balneolaceae bacterium]
MFACSPSQSEPEVILSVNITPDDVETHITFLAADELNGREAGTPDEAKAANYIADYFRDFGLEPAGDDRTFFQEFTINTALLNNPHASEDDTTGEKRLSKNVAGLLQGTGDSDEFIIIGAHYDHLGYGEFGSLYRGEVKRIHNGADDNASGTTGLLELAQYFSENRPSTDILFLAFSGEEMGLLGSAHYANNPTVDLDNALAMINMDMIGRMNEEKKLIIFGVGTAEKWTALVDSANTGNLNLDLVEDGTGASDHTSFYYKDIPVLHYFTDTHSDYHRPSDDTEYINHNGVALALHHLVRVIVQLDELDKSDMEFIAAPGEQRQSMRLEGPTLGVLPDYGYDGEGMKITGTNDGGAAANAGLESGDIIVGLGGKSLEDIYGYMEALNGLKKGQLTTVTVLRNGERLTLDLQL